MKRILRLSPEAAALYLAIIPNVSWIVLLILGTVFKLALLLAMFWAVVILYMILSMLLRFSLGIISYKFLPKDIINPRAGYVFFICSMIFYIPVIAGCILLISIDVFPETFLLILIILGILGLPVSWIQCHFIARNISVLYNKDILRKDLWPVSFASICYYPLNTKKLHKVLAKLFNDNVIA